MAAKQDLRERKVCAAAALAADWRLRKPPFCRLFSGQPCSRRPSAAITCGALVRSSGQRSRSKQPRSIPHLQRKAPAGLPRALSDPGNAAVRTARSGGALKAGKGLPEVWRYRSSHRFSSLSRRGSSPNRFPTRWNREAVLCLLARCPAQQFPASGGQGESGGRRREGGLLPAPGQALPHVGILR